MSRKEDIINVLSNESRLTQSQIASRIYGDDSHSVAIYTCLMKLVERNIVIREGSPARYSLVANNGNNSNAVQDNVISNAQNGVEGHEEHIKKTQINILLGSNEIRAYYTIWELNNLIHDVSLKAGNELKPGEDFYVVWQGFYHSPAKLPEGYMAVYSFHTADGDCLKVGQVGLKSNDRYQHQHYKVYRNRPNSSTLAKSIVEDPTLRYLGLNDNTVGDWIKENCERFDVIIKACSTTIPSWKTKNKIVLNTIEGILQMYFQPKYEG